jgi:cbb3-type cytochrome oxidase maturation protein
MNILYLLIPLALLLGGSALAGFILAVRNGQFDDLETPGLRALIDDSETQKGKKR